jgi:hypothetical protein
MRHDGIPRTTEDWIQYLDKRVSQLERQKTFLISNGTKRITVGTTTPTTPTTHDMWLDTTTPALKFWNGSTWVSV